jgi:hypothetical protein
MTRTSSSAGPLAGGGGPASRAAAEAGGATVYSTSTVSLVNSGNRTLGRPSGPGRPTWSPRATGSGWPACPSSTSSRCSTTPPSCATLERRVSSDGDDGRFDTDTHRQSVEHTLNVRAFLRWAGVNLLIGSWDNYFATPSNYFLYNSGRRGDDRGFAASPDFTFIPWDYDTASTSTTPAPLAGHRPRRLGQHHRELRTAALGWGAVADPAGPAPAPQPRLPPLLPRRCRGPCGQPPAPLPDLGYPPRRGPNNGGSGSRAPIARLPESGRSAG